MQFTREEAVAATIALFSGAVAAGASGNTAFALCLLGALILVVVLLQVPPLGRLVGLHPDIKFLEDDGA